MLLCCDALVHSVSHLLHFGHEDALGVDVGGAR